MEFAVHSPFLATSLLLKLLKQHLISVQNSFILDPFCSSTVVILVLFLQIVWIKFVTRQISFFPFSASHVSLSFPSVPKTFILFVTVATLSFLSPVHCRSREVEGSFMHKVNYDWNLHSSGLLHSVDW